MISRVALLLYLCGAKGIWWVPMQGHCGSSRRVAGSRHVLIELSARMRWPLSSETCVCIVVTNVGKPCHELAVVLKVIEQPSSSLLLLHDRMQELLKRGAPRAWFHEGARWHAAASR